VSQPELVESPLRGNAHGGFGAAGRRDGPSRKHGTALRPDPTYYDHRRCRDYLTRRAVKVRIAPPWGESSTRLGRHRWKAERSIARVAGYWRLRIRYDRDAERFFAFAMLACARLGDNRLPGTATAHARAP